MEQAPDRPLRRRPDLLAPVGVVGRAPGGVDGRSPDPGKGHGVLFQALADLAGRASTSGSPSSATVPSEPTSSGWPPSSGPRAGRVRRAVDQDAIREHYRHAAVFCLPSFAEGVPVVLMEAMAMGLPVWRAISWAWASSSPMARADSSYDRAVRTSRPR